MAWAAAGPIAFAAAAIVGGRREPGYRGVDEAISALAAKGSPAASVMVPGFLCLGASSIGLGRNLAGSPAAPRPVPALLCMAGLTTAGAGLFRCSDRSCPTRWLGDLHATRSDEVHGLFSVATFALWIATPLVAAARADTAEPRYRRRSARLASATLAAFLAGGMLTRRPAKRWSGAAQRAMVASALSWYPLVAIADARGDRDQDAVWLRKAGRQ